MGFSFTIATIDHREPTLWIAIVVAAGVAWFAGHALGRRLARIEPRATRWSLGVPAILLIAYAFRPCTFLLLDIFFTIRTGGDQVCPAFVGLFLYIPSMGFAVMSAVTWSRSRP